MGCKRCGKPLPRYAKRYCSKECRGRDREERKLASVKEMTQLERLRAAGYAAPRLRGKVPRRVFKTNKDGHVIEETTDVQIAKQLYTKANIEFSTGTKEFKLCAKCDKPFIPRSSLGKYCSLCAYTNICKDCGKRVSPVSVRCRPCKYKFQRTQNICRKCGNPISVKAAYEQRKGKFKGCKSCPGFKVPLPKTCKHCSGPISKHVALRQRNGQPHCANCSPTKKKPAPD